MTHKMNIAAAYLIGLCMGVSCADKEDTPVTVLAAPSELDAKILNSSTVKLSWKDNADGEKGYRLYIRDNGQEHLKASLGADAKAYAFTGLTASEDYGFGVQAYSDDASYDSETVWLDTFHLTDPDKKPQVTEVKSSYAYIAVSYKVDRLSVPNPEHGIILSCTDSEIRCPGPTLSAGTEILQVIPAAAIEPDRDYQMSVYVKDSDRYEYSAPQTVRLQPQPASVNLAWEKVEYAGIDEGIDIYRTQSQLNGRSFNAWYAMADPAKVDFRVMYPEAVGAKKSVEAQAQEEEDCEVLINGAIFGNYNIGVIITEGKMTQQWHGEIEGCYWGTDNQMYQITRPIIGTDSDGRAGAYWTGVPQQGTFWYYDRPQTSITAQAKYGKVTATSPSDAIAWTPHYAISCGPMVLYDGKVCADNTTVDGTHFYTNYECWDESGVYSAHPDRSAIGVTADGKIVLFICDGRIDCSQGAYMHELGPIMREIGCVHAMNLDGGGSTGMWIKGAGMINHRDGDSWRAVKSTVGFFKKQTK